MSTQPEPAQPETEAGRALLEAFFQEAAFPDDPGAAILAIEHQATAAARAEVARQVRELPGYIEQRGAGELVEYVVLRAAVLALLEDAAPRQPEPETSNIGPEEWANAPKTRWPTRPPEVDAEGEGEPRDG